MRSQAKLLETLPFDSAQDKLALKRRHVCWACRSIGWFTP